MIVGNAEHCLFALAAAFLLVLNTLILWLLPAHQQKLQQAQPHPACQQVLSASLFEATTTAQPTSASIADTFLLPSFSENSSMHAAPAVWKDLQLRSRTHLNISALRVLPRWSSPFLPSKQKRWIAIGISSVQRQSAEFLRLTLAHLFASTEAGELNDMLVVVHLADADEGWVSHAAAGLENAFADHLLAGRLHVIHAPTFLYPPAGGWGKPKFKDTKERQQWRSKQNLDYMFLMRYSAELAETYLQLEDDVQVVPNFVRRVRHYVRMLSNRRQPWNMVAFSHMGFIGKLFPSQCALRLAEFLGAFFDQSPCDWLVWNFLDIISLEPLTSQIPDDLEREEQERHKPGKHPLPRNDVVLLYTSDYSLLLGPVGRAAVSTDAPLQSNMPLPTPRFLHIGSQPAPAVARGIASTSSSSTKADFLPRLAPNPDSLASRKDEHTHLPLLFGALTGTGAGIVGWLVVFLGLVQCSQGAARVGDLPIWVTTFVFVSDVLLFLLAAPSSALHASTGSFLKVPCSGTSTSIPPLQKLKSIEYQPLTLQTQALPGWTALQFGWRRLDPALLQVVPQTAKDSSFLPSGVDATGLPDLRFLALGIEVRPSRLDSLLSKTLPELFRVMDQEDRPLCTVVLNLIESDNEWVQTARNRISSLFPGEVRNGLLRALHVPVNLQPRREDLEVPPLRLGDTPEKQMERSKANLDCAFLLWYASWFGSYYMQIEDDSHGLAHGFVGTLHSRVKSQRNTNWNMLSLSKLGLNRKLLRGGEQLRRLAELILSFHDTTHRDAILWDFLDIFQNLAAPKAARLQIDAGERIDKGHRQRADVALQYHESKVSMIEHLGDVSSLRGKVQDIRDPYFQKHRLQDSLFNCPPVSVRTNLLLPDAAQRISALYGLQGRTLSWFSTQDALHQPPHDSSEPWFVELVLETPAVIEFFLMRMGSHLKPGKGQAGMDHFLNDADLEVAAEAPGGSCTAYRHISKISHREALVYVGPHPMGILGQAKCIRVAVRTAQLNPWTITTLQLRTKETSIDDAGDARRSPEPRMVGEVMPQKEEDDDNLEGFHLAVSGAVVFGLMVLLIGHIARHGNRPRRRSDGHDHDEVELGHQKPPSSASSDVHPASDASSSHRGRRPFKQAKQKNRKGANNIK